MRVSTALAGVRRRNLLAAAGASLLMVCLAPGASSVHASGSSVISGTVFQDLNRNGVRDTAEAGFSSLRMNLYDSTGTNIAAAYTDASGSYQFTGLSDGSYVVAPDGSAWTSYNDSWVMTTIPTPAPNYLTPHLGVSLTGSATASFALRPITRSTATPFTTYQAPDGMLVQSYDDVVPASAIYAALSQGQFMGTPASPYTTINFDFGPNPNITTFSCGGSPGAYSSYSAVTTLTYAAWRDQFDDLLFHEHGHEWSLYTACIVQQDLSLNGYLQARGLLGNPLVGSSYAWDPKEMIAEDYRQLFGTANAASYPQINTAIPPASQVAGLKDWLEYTFTAPPTSTQAVTSQPLPTVAGVTPGVAPSSGGTQVTITGSNFAGSGYAASAVSFGGLPATSFAVVSPTQITAVAPTGTGAVNVTVTTDATGGTLATSSISSADVFTYVPQPSVSSISPTSGSRRGGTMVTVYGSNFTGTGYTVISVQFGAVTASSVTVLSSTKLTAVAPPGTVHSTAYVTVTTAGGTSAGSTSCAFTYTPK